MTAWTAKGHLNLNAIGAQRQIGGNSPNANAGRRGPGRIESKTFLARMFANNFIDGEKREGE